MDKEQQLTILGDAVKENGDLYHPIRSLSWTVGDALAILDGRFDADELEAIAAWMREHSGVRA